MAGFPGLDELFENLFVDGPALVQFAGLPILPVLSQIFSVDDRNSGSRISLFPARE